MNDYDLTISYIPYTIPNYPTGHSISTQSKKNMWIFLIDGEGPVTDKGSLEEIKHHQYNNDKSKVNIGLCKMKSY